MNVFEHIGCPCQNDAAFPALAAVAQEEGILLALRCGVAFTQ